MAPARTQDHGDPSDQRAMLLAGASIVALCLVVFAPTLRHDFVWDDLELVFLWTANNDARSFAIVGESSTTRMRSMGSSSPGPRPSRLAGEVGAAGRSMPLEITSHVSARRAPGRIPQDA